MNVMIFGPNGIGKSTVIRELQRRGDRAFDLEDHFNFLPPHEAGKLRVTLAKAIDDAYIGAADVSPHGVELWGNAKKVLLYASQPIYELRRAERNLRVPEKASQKLDNTNKWLTFTDWDYVVDAEKPLSEIVSDIEKYTCMIDSEEEESDADESNIDNN